MCFIITMNSSTLSFTKGIHLVHWFRSSGFECIVLSVARCHNCFYICHNLHAITIIWTFIRFP